MTIQEAFKLDGFNVLKTVKTKTGAGYLAQNPNAKNYLNNEYKLAYYLEGSPEDMGFQMGHLAHDKIRQMVIEFPPAVISGFLTELKDQVLKDLIIIIIYSILITKSKSVVKDIPVEYVDEVKGIVKGVHSVNLFALDVTFETVWVLNVGFDILQALLSDPTKLLGEIKSHKLATNEVKKLDENIFRINLFCNAYSAYNDKTHFFGRDWMLNGGDVLETCAALIISKPNDKRKPIVYAAPVGLVGAALAMNNDGIAMGVDMVSAANSNYAEPGFNSILLVRDCIHRSDSAKAVVDHATSARRGAAFIYPVSDGKNNTSCVIEAGMKIQDLDPLQYVPELLRPLLPTYEILEQQGVEKPNMGLIARWRDYNQGMFFIDTYNKNIWEITGRNFIPENWGETGFVYTKPFKDKEALTLFYFNPLRQNLNPEISEKQADNLIKRTFNSENGSVKLFKDNWKFQLVTNAWLNPYMNICSMSFWASAISVPYWADIQWRYDLLNKALSSNQNSELQWDNAWEMINFLSPVIGYGPGRDYYKLDSPYKLPIVTYVDEHGKPQQTWRVDGMVNLCDLKNKKVRSLYGTYADNYVEITLPNYV